MSKSALVLIADGTEELEFVATYDVLVRGGIKVHSAYVGSSAQSTDAPHSHSPHAECSRGVKIVPDLRLPDLDKGKALEYDAIIVPGGAPGAKTISENKDVQALIAKFYADGKLVGAICAGSLAIKTSGIAKDTELTSHPSVKGELQKGEQHTALGSACCILLMPLICTCRLPLLGREGRSTRQSGHIVSDVTRTAIALQSSLTALHAVTFAALADEDLARPSCLP